MTFSLRSLFPNLPQLKVIDVGASPIDGDPPYQPLFESGQAQVLGFEPDEVQLEALRSLGHANATYLGDALGDGEEHELHICRSPGMTSLLEPDAEVLEHFHGFPEWAEVVRKQKVQTRRLDDVSEARGSDYIKIDVQGAELAVLEHGKEVLSECLVCHIELQFVPFYKDQPLFAELDQVMREAGFWLHRFTPIQSRVFKPLLVDGDIYAGLSQQLWTDGIYFRRFTDFSTMSEPQLEKIAMVAHDLYGSIDLASLALKRLDERDEGVRQGEYLRALTEQKPQAAPGPV